MPQSLGDIARKHKESRKGTSVANIGQQDVGGDTFKAPKPNAGESGPDYAKRVRKARAAWAQARADKAKAQEEAAKRLKAPETTPSPEATPEEEEEKKEGEG